MGLNLPLSFKWKAGQVLILWVKGGPETKQHSPPGLHKLRFPCVSYLKPLPSLPSSAFPNAPPTPSTQREDLPMNSYDKEAGQILRTWEVWQVVG